MIHDQPNQFLLFIRFCPQKFHYDYIQSQKHLSQTSVCLIDWGLTPHLIIFQSVLIVED